MLLVHASQINETLLIKIIRKKMSELNTLKETNEGVKHALHVYKVIFAPSYFRPFRHAKFIALSKWGVRVIACNVYL